MQKLRVCLVTGGMGFIGTHLLGEIEKIYNKIIVVDNLSPNIHPEPPKLHFVNALLVIGGVEESKTWDEVAALLPAKDFVLDVYHLAADTSTGNSIKAPSAHVSTNILGTALMCEFLAERIESVGRVKLTSTRAIYGEGLWETSDGELVNPDQRRKIDLDRQEWNPHFRNHRCINPAPVSASAMKPNPVNIYGSTKLAQEQMLTIWCAYYGVQLNVYRLQNVYGPGQSLWNSYSGIVSLFVRKALLGESIEVYEGGGIIRDFVFVSDVVKVLVEDMAQTAQLQIFDVGTGRPVTLLQVANVISEICGSVVVGTSVNYRLGDVRGIFADTDSIKEMKSFKSFTQVNAGLQKLIEWAKPEILGDL